MSASPPSAESGRIRSFLVELLRQGDLGTGFLREKDPYLLTAAARPVETTLMPLSHTEFVRFLRELRPETRRDGGATGSRSHEKILAELGDKIREFAGASVFTELDRDDGNVQIDLVANAAELAALPFEAITDAAGTPLLGRGERMVELTRRVRHDFAETRRGWPTKPRVLYAWSAAGGRVPSDAHRDALRRALDLSWAPQPTPASQAHRAPGSEGTGPLVELPRATSADIEHACRAAEADRHPFTHVHLLAHGHLIGPPEERHFGLALDGGVASPDRLSHALGAQPYVVTLAACDSGNQANAAAGTYSIAHQLHTRGIPVVVASQLPLTVAGSVVLIKALYEPLLRGVDVRRALHGARVALREQRATTHADWVSLVAYVQLPEGYAQDLVHVCLEAEMSSFRRVRARTDTLLAQSDPAPADLDACRQRLDESLARLASTLPNTRRAGIPGTLPEHLGLLASGHKLRAELGFRRHAPDADVHADLTRARDLYREGFVHDPSAHWNGVQSLSLEAVLHGRIADATAWHAALFAARVAAEAPTEYWALGSLTELYLLAPLAGQPAPEPPEQALREMLTRVRAHAAGSRDPLDSTRDQLLRYTTWWRTDHAFFPGTSDLAKPTAELLAVLNSQR